MHDNVKTCLGPDDGKCDALAVCPVCDRCERHDVAGGSGLCAAASWPSDAVRRAQDELAAENGLLHCICGGLEDPMHPHRRCRVRAV